VKMSSRADFSSYCVMSIWFGCNNHCTICMLSEVEQTLSGLTFDRFKEVTASLAEEGRYRNLILSGGEVTTFQDLGRYVRFAASLGWFEKIQIQTNGRRLADRHYVEHLIDCGVNEFFVSVQGLVENHDATTRVPGSFRQTMKGIDNLAGRAVGIITNTVLTTQNLPDIDALVDFLIGQPVNEVQIWNFFPMERTDSGNRVVALGQFAGLLPGLAASAARAEKPVVLKSFPECLSSAPPLVFDNVFPATVLPDLFWKQFGQCGFGQCVHRKAGRCTARSCWGLSSAYLEKYGDERELLKPVLNYKL
jgi:sulfatase maturation enzyme AslB (radical SAM superfamily)